MGHSTNRHPAPHVIRTGIMGYGDVLDWARVGRNPVADNTFRRYFLSHSISGPNGPSSVDEVVVHLQGFVQKVNLHPLGDWNPR